MTNESEREGRSRSAMAHPRRKARAGDGAPRGGPPANKLRSVQKRGSANFGYRCWVKDLIEYIVPAVFLAEILERRAQTLAEDDPNRNWYFSEARRLRACPNRDTIKVYSILSDE